MQGKIIKGIAGFYYVYVRGRGIYECKARGAFRKKKIKPVAGDAVEIEITDPVDAEGNIVSIAERRSLLIRPTVANGSGPGDLRGKEADAEFQSSGPLLSHDGTGGNTDDDSL